MNQHPFWWSSISQAVAPIDFIDVDPSSYTFSYESGLTNSFQISGTTGYTITTGASWLSIDITGGTSGVTYAIFQTMSINSGVTNRTQLVTVTSLDLSINEYVTITQIFEPQPPLFIMTEGGQFVGDLV